MLRFPIAAEDLHISQIASLPPEQREQIWNELTEEEATALLYDWTFHARPKQLPPVGDWFCWMLRSGRGFGKTRTGAEWVISRAMNGPYHPIALVGQTKADVRDTMIEIGDSSILKISPPWFMPDYQPSKRRLVWPNGMIAMVYSGDEPGQLRGPQHGSAWVDELAKFKYPQDTWDQLLFGLRLGINPQVVVTTTPRPIPVITEIIGSPGTVEVTGSSYENLDNLSIRYRETVLSRYEGTRLGRQEIHGEILDDVPGALWNRAMLDDNRVSEAPPLSRIVVAVDPAVTAKDGSDETGIVVGGVVGEHGYVLEDCSLKASPAKWARRAIWAYYKWEADRIVAEGNQGGDMVKHTIHTEDPNVPVKLVRATKGKYTRAEPVAALYEQERIHHVGVHPELEDQMCTYVPGEDSPDRMDALVWAFTELMLGNQWRISV